MYREEKREGWPEEKMKLEKRGGRAKGVGERKINKSSARVFTDSHLKIIYNIQNYF